MPDHSIIPLLYGVGGTFIAICVVLIPLLILL
jgi:hypothetical protein